MRVIVEGCWWFSVENKFSSLGKTSNKQDRGWLIYDKTKKWSKIGLICAYFSSILLCITFILFLSTYKKTYMIPVRSSSGIHASPIDHTGNVPFLCAHFFVKRTEFILNICINKHKILQ